MTGAKVFAIRDAVLVSPIWRTVVATTRMTANHPEHGVHAFRDLRTAAREARPGLWGANVAIALCVPAGETEIGERGWHARAAEITTIYLHPRAWSHAPELAGRYGVPVRVLPRSVRETRSRSMAAEGPVMPAAEARLRMRYAPSVRPQLRRDHKGRLYLDRRDRRVNTGASALVLHSSMIAQQWREEYAREGILAHNRWQVERLRWRLRNDARFRSLHQQRMRQMQQRLAAGARTARDPQRTHAASTLADIVPHPSGGRFRVRKVNAGAQATAILAALIADGPSKQRWRAAAHHGGDVANAYSYPAETETCGVVGYRDGDSIWLVVCAGRIPANKATQRGAANDTLGGEWTLMWDGRSGRKPEMEYARDYAQTYGQRYTVRTLRDGSTVVAGRLGWVQSQKKIIGG